MLAVGMGLLWPRAATSLAGYRHHFLVTVMFLVGLEHSLPALAQQFKKFHLVLLSLGLSFACFPLLAWIFGRLFFDYGTALAGFVVLGAVPTTLTSAVIYTRLDRGNDRLALVIVLFSQVICVVVTPALMTLFLAKSVRLDTFHMMQQLLLYFLFPLTLGMMLARFLPLDKIKPYLIRPEQLVVALFVFMGAGHIPHDTPWGLIGKTVVAVILLQMSFVVFVRLVIRRIPAADQTALFFTGTQKTMTVGLYLLLSYFPSAAVLPMVLYHLMQLTIGRLYWVPPQLKRVDS